MKKLFLFVFGFFISLTMIAQGNNDDKRNEKNKSKKEKSVNRENKEQKEKEEKDVKDAKEAKEKIEKEEHNKKVWEGTSGKRGKGPKSSKNQPAKVRAAFQSDYPNATNVSWTKYRGDWTATFGNGLVMSTAVYHANGERRDTRTPIKRNEVPRNVLDSIFKRGSSTRLDDIIKIEPPGVAKNIFRIKDIILGNPEYFYYDSDGWLVKYNY